MATLNTITADYRALLDLVDHVAEAGGEIDTDTDALIALLSHDLMGQLEQKADAYAAVIDEHQTWAGFYAAKRKTLAAKQNAHEAIARRMKEQMMRAMNVMGRKRLETQPGGLLLTVCANGGVQPVEITGEPDALPPYLQRVRVTANTELIREKLQAGEEITGCKLLDRGYHLRVK